MSIAGQYLRTEDGALFVPPSNGFQLARWCWLRTEDGNEVLWGPQGFTVITQDAAPTLRVEAGDVRILLAGHGP